VKLAHCRNQPNVHEVKKLSNSGKWHGAQLTLIIAGHWQVRPAVPAASSVCPITSCMRVFADCRWSAVAPSDRRVNITIRSFVPQTC
jgi:hypothetical protein